MLFYVNSHYGNNDSNIYAYTMDGSDVIDSISDFQIISQSQSGDYHQGFQTLINFTDSDDLTPIFMTEVFEPSMAGAFSSQNTFTTHEGHEVVPESVFDTSLDMEGMYTSLGLSADTTNNLSILSGANSKQDYYTLEVGQDLLVVDMTRGSSEFYYIDTSAPLKLLIFSCVQSLQSIFCHKWSTISWKL